MSTDFDRIEEALASLDEVSHGWSDGDGTPTKTTRDALAAVASLRSRMEAQEKALREFLVWFDAQYPEGQSYQLPGLTLWDISKHARAALPPEQTG